MTVELREFLEARLADDEAAALAACGGPKRPEARVAFGGHWHADPWHDGTRERCDLNAGVGGWLTGSGALDVAVGEHAARHDPARVLRDVEAKRRLLAQHQAVCDEVRSPKSAEHRMNARARQFALDEVLATLALPYSDHPDYDPSWLPEATA